MHHLVQHGYVIQICFLDYGFSHCHPLYFHGRDKHMEISIPNTKLYYTVQNVYYEFLILIQQFKDKFGHRLSQKCSSQNYKFSVSVKNVFKSKSLLIKITFRMSLKLKNKNYI